MRLTLWTDYALRTLIHVGAKGESLSTIAEIAATFAVSKTHLMKIVNRLARQGYVETVRGKGGGMRLAREPRDICIGKVVRGTEGQDMPAECFAPDGGHCVITRCCGLKRALAQAMAAFYEVLDRYSLEDISSNRRALARILMIRAA